MSDETYYCANIRDTDHENWKWRPKADIHLKDVDSVIKGKPPVADKGDAVTLINNIIRLPNEPGINYLEIGFILDLLERIVFLEARIHDRENPFRQVGHLHQIDTRRRLIWI